MAECEPLFVNMLDEYDSDICCPGCQSGWSYKLGDAPAHPERKCGYCPECCDTGRCAKQAEGHPTAPENGE